MANLFSYTKVKQRNSAIRWRIRPADLDVCALRPAVVRAHSVQEDHCEEDHCESRDFLLVNKNLSLSLSVSGPGVQNAKDREVSRGQ